jgi:hypothetical protein
MKTHSSKQGRLAPHRGFALVVTLSLMILLTIIAVGLLTLSSVTLRASGQGEAMAKARNNAKLALMLAIGELQGSAGPDQRVTAPANLMDPASSPGITGVWESWKPSAEGEIEYDQRKEKLQTTKDLADGEFVTWLASGDPTLPLLATDPPGEVAQSGAAITLVSERNTPTEAGTEKIAGTYLNPTLINEKGGMAWSVMDEGVKARFELPTEATLASDTDRKSRLRAPARPQAESISAATAALRLDSSTAAKTISLDEAEIIAGKGLLRPHLHDITPYSASLPVNVSAGGIKADLTRAFEATKLPTDLTGRYVYANSKTSFSPADPLFSTLADHYLLYKKPVNPLAISAPKTYRPMTPFPVSPGQVPTPNLAVLDGTLVAPVITRTSVVFSLVSRVAHGNWLATIPNTTGDSLRRNMVYLIYTPVVTVYNPYSVPIRFSDLKVTFRNLPVAFKFFRNGVAQTAQHTLLSTFHILSQDRTDWDDRFSCTVSNTAGSASGSQITLYPGEARVFGTNHAASAGWNDITNYLWTGSLDSSKTFNIYSGAGWDYRTGYVVDWLRPAIGTRTTDNKDLGVFGVRPTDTVNVEVVPKMPGSGGGKLTVDFQAKVNGRDTAVGIYEYNYGTDAKLTEILQNGNHTTIGQVKFPFRRERDFTVSELTLPNPEGTPIKQWGSVPKQFAIFTLGTRNAHDSLYPGKPGKTSSFVHHVLKMDATKNHPALLPMEMSLLPITGTGANTVGSIDADDVNRAFHFSGSSRGNGTIQYVSQNIPSAPLVNLADFRHANLASSGHLPLVQHTVGESLASPAVPPGEVKTSSTFGYESIDHTWLANQTLWDGYYFSGIRDLNDATQLFDSKPISLNPRHIPLVSTGIGKEEAAKKAISDSGWSDLASMMAIKGGFNVNSTSKNAWKATLTSLKGLEVPVLGPVVIQDPAVDPSTYKEVLVTTQTAAFPRLSRPIGERLNAGNSTDNQRRWSGFRELSEPEVDLLATEIVKEVRERGPFLSLAEFVNRRRSAGTGERAEFMAARGALEEAIRKSKVNELPMGPASRIISEDEARGFGFANPKAAAGNTEEGASAILSQGDLLSAIGTSITVRSDTFVIRSYGDAREGSRITAKVWCEAVIQRVPSFVDPADAPEKVQSAVIAAGRSMADLSAVNRRFGRRFEVVSFRWLTKDEV